MLNWLRSYFSFTKKELNGILVLCMLIVAINIYPAFYSPSFKEEPFDFNSYKAEIDRFYASETKKHTASKYNPVNKETKSNVLIAEYFEFDPNNLSPGEWKRLGLSDRQIKVIQNYEAKGGKFYKKEDLKKIYSISAEEFRLLEPYIKIEAFGTRAPSRNLTSGAPNLKRPPVNVEINSADSTELETLTGIGPAFASRIVKYRKRLGGFHSIEQLQEVYGIDSLKFDQFKHEVYVDETAVVKININEAGFDELKQNPYLSYKQMNAILQYRRQHGSYTSLADLRKIKILNDEILRKIAPYFTF